MIKIVFLADIPCLGQDSCFPLAFGVPALLLIIATGKKTIYWVVDVDSVVFLLGSPHYRRPKVESNVLADFVRVLYVRKHSKFSPAVC